MTSLGFHDPTFMLVRASFVIFTVSERGWTALARTTRPSGGHHVFTGREFEPDPYSVKPPLRHDPPCTEPDIRYITGFPNAQISPNTVFL